MVAEADAINRVATECAILVISGEGR